MSGYEVEFTSAAERELKKLDRATQAKILSAVAALGRDPFVPVFRLTIS
ncbi:type II toxin-antitoxin system RelE family toxin [Streptomyces marincola]|nr:hypothetical protein [Streptomyces marincola]UCM88501.1 hypothetical protein LC193_11365 [Streptomyces marincola]